jgi:hypothetical protein
VIEQAKSGLKVSISQVNGKLAGKVVSSRFLKSQTESWFVIVGHQKSNRVLGLKRLTLKQDNTSRDNDSGRKGSSQALEGRVEFKVANWRERQDLTVFVASDIYLGYMIRQDHILSSVASS